MARERERERERERVSQSVRQTDRQTERGRQTETERESDRTDLCQTHPNWRLRVCHCNPVVVCMTRMGVSKSAKQQRQQ